MTKIRINGKFVTTTLALKRDRRRARKSEARQTSEGHQEAARRHSFYYNAKQSRRWLSVRLLSDDCGSLTKDVASELHQHLLKSEYQLQHPGIADAVLTKDAKLVLAQLESERKAARSEQGNPERVKDWWGPPTMLGKKKRKKMKKDQSQGTIAAEEISNEMVEDVGMEEEESRFWAEEGAEGLESPVMMSPTGSLMGDEEEGEVE